MILWRPPMALRYLRRKHCIIEEVPGVASIRSVCVFCGSSHGANPRFSQETRAVGEMIARRGWDLVYGGGKVGLMGELADAALAAGGHVVGVIPGMLVEREVGHAGLSELHVVRTMAERKALMGDRSDAFLTLPGGIGTLDELSEAWTWTQLGLQRKPSGLLNVDGYFDPLLAFLDRAVTAAFLPERHRRLLLVDDDAERVLDRLEHWEPARSE